MLDGPQLKFGNSKNNRDLIATFSPGFYHFAQAERCLGSILTTDQSLSVVVDLRRPLVSLPSPEAFAADRIVFEICAVDGKEQVPLGNKITVISVSGKISERFVHDVVDLAKLRRDYHRDQRYVTSRGLEIRSGHQASLLISCHEVGSTNSYETNQDALKIQTVLQDLSGGKEAEISYMFQAIYGMGCRGERVIHISPALGVKLMLKPLLARVEGELRIPAEKVRSWDADLQFPFSDASKVWRDISARTDLLL